MHRCGLALWDNRPPMGAHLRIEPKLPAAFQRLRAATWVSNTGDGVRNAALPLIAASLTGSATMVAATAAAGTVPFALFGLLAGTVADRRGRIPLIASAHLLRGVVVAGLALLLAIGQMTVPLLLVGAFLLGCGEALADSAGPALLPDLVDPDRLEEANGKLETAELIANDLAGPPVGSLLFAANPAAPFVADAVSFATAAGLVRSIRADESHVDETLATTWTADLREGAATAWTNPVLRVTGSLVVLVQFGNVAAVAPIVIYVTERLGLAPAAYGAFLAVGSLGGVLGSLLVARLVKRFGTLRSLVGSLVLSGGAFGLMMVPVLAATVIGFFLSFAAVVVGRVIVVTARQRSVPRRLLGRAQGAMRTVVWGSATVGALVGGVLADRISGRAPFALAAACYAVAIVAWWRPLRRVLVPAEARPVVAVH